MNSHQPTSSPQLKADSRASVSIAFQQMRAGEQSGARRLWEHFFPRLVGLARTTLANRPQRVADADAEDAALISKTNWALRHSC